MSTAVRSSLKSLAWKEWRESLPALAIGAAAAVIIRVGSFIQISLSNRPASVLETIRDTYSLIAFALLFPAFFLLIGADRFSSEKTAGTLPYLLSLPASKFRIWLAKLGVALGSGLILIAFALLINPFLVEHFAESSEQGFQENFLRLLAVYVLLLLASFTASIVLRNPLAAAFAGASGLAVFVVAFILLDFFAVHNLVNLIAGNPIGRYSNPSVQLGVLLAFCAAVSLYLFNRLKTDSSAFRKAGLVLLASAGALAAMLLLDLGNNVPCLLLRESDVARAGQIASLPGGDTVLFTIANRYGYSRICSVPTSGGSAVRLPGKSMSSPSFSPDGRTVLCNPDNLTWPQAMTRSHFPRFPLRILLGPALWEGWTKAVSPEAYEDWWSIEYSCRIMLLRFPDAKVDWVKPVRTERGFDFVDNLSSACWSPDGTQFVASSHSGLVIVRLGKNFSIKQIPPGVEVYPPSSWPAGWSEDGKEFFFTEDQWGKDGNMSSLCRFDPGSGKTAVLFTAQKRHVCGFCPSKKLVYTRDWQQRSSLHRLFVTDWGTGEERVLAENSVGSYWYRRLDERLYSSKSGVFLFAAHEPTEKTNELRLFVPDLGTARTLTRAPHLVPLSLSPDERWGIYYYRNEEPGPGGETIGLYSVSLETGENHTFAETGVNFYEGVSWAKGPTVIFVKGKKEIWSAAVDGSRLRQLYPEKTR